MRSRDEGRHPGGQRQYTIREAGGGDGGTIREMLYHAIHVPEGSPPPDSSIVLLPALSRYYAGWGRDGDEGFLVLREEAAIAAVWLRLFDSGDPGYGFVRGDIPELGMAVKEGHRNGGLGTLLLERLFSESSAHRYGAVSLSVGRTNRAVSLYRRFGFTVHRETDDSYTMIKTL
ncbi:MAG: GNAT family N-acetyltransferase [Spirochaetes bacterium]|nr:GNAT family N-acetyltransferase [Spirochaetota bacterium]